MQQAIQPEIISHRIPDRTQDTRRPRTKTLLLVFAVFSVAFTVRILAILPTLEKDNIQDYYRIGTVPFSDAAGWFKGAIEISRGEKLSEFPARRPLYPLFLSWLAGLTGCNAQTMITLQAFLVSVVIGCAFLLIKEPWSPVFTSVFTVFLVLWRIRTPAVFMSENLGMMVFIAAAAFLLRGIRLRSGGYLAAGMFLYGLGEAVRPWAVFGLLTIPFLSLYLCNGPAARRFKAVAACFLFVFSGFGVHPLACAVFNGPDAGSNFALTLYGQAAGGKEYTAALRDPVIQEKIREKPIRSELNRVVYKRALKLVQDDPLNILRAAFNSFNHFRVSMPDTFSESLTGPPWRHILLLFFLWIGTSGKKYIRTLKVSRGFLGTTASALLILFFYPWFWTILLVLGFLHVSANSRRPENTFCMLLFLGIMASIPFLGMDGGGRVRLSFDILSYTVCALALSRLFSGEFKWTLSPAPENGSPVRFFFPWKGPLLTAGAIVLFIGGPLLAGMFADNHPGQNPADALKTPIIAGMPGPDNSILSDGMLDSIGNLWPAPSFERIDGRVAFREIRYSGCYALFYAPGEGIAKSPWPDYHWPFLPAPYPRTLYIEGRHWTEFPFMTPATLGRFGGKRLYVCGTIKARPRTWVGHTGYLLIATYFGEQKDSGEIAWQPIESFSNP